MFTRRETVHLYRKISSFFFFFFPSSYNTRSIHLSESNNALDRERRNGGLPVPRTSASAYVARFWFTGWGTIPRPVHPPTFEYHSNRRWRPIGMVYLSSVVNRTVSGGPRVRLVVAPNTFIYLFIYLFIYFTLLHCTRDPEFLDGFFFPLSFPFFSRKCRRFLQ